MTEQTGTNLRVVTYNVHGLADDRQALVTLVRELKPDVLVLQEAPRRFRWRHKCAALAHDLGMVVAVGGGPGLGNLILTDLRVWVTDTGIRRLPHTPGRHLRGAVVAHCRIGSTPFTVVGTHLSYDPVELPEHAQQLSRWLTQLPGPVILAGDLNDQPGGPAWEILQPGRVDAATVDGAVAADTFPAVAPDRRIDAILVDPEVTVRSCWVVDSAAARRASDHLPVVADLQL
ncbi:MAG TPA: endonuclease/exonuclease/phosphatase family protein [Natronosporangium sp.]|nr:endonuclease/exonuclease/phosphatase family protein [Natronosporangium sp.]